MLNDSQFITIPKERISIGARRINSDVCLICLEEHLKVDAVKKIKPKGSQSKQTRTKKCIKQIRREKLRTFELLNFAI